MNENAIIIEEHQKAIQKPHIRRTLDAMRGNLDHGAEWPTEFFEENLGFKRDTARFGQSMHKVQLQLESEGFHLTTRGKNAKSYWVEPVERSSAVVSAMQRQVMSKLRRSAVFAAATVERHSAKLTELQQRRLQHQQRTQALRFVTMSRMR